MFKKTAQTSLLPSMVCLGSSSRAASPLAVVLSVGNACNLRCRHCAVYPRKPEDTLKKSYETIREELEKCYRMGSRFVDFEGASRFVWLTRIYDQRPVRSGQRDRFLLDDGNDQRTDSVRSVPERSCLGQSRRCREIPRSDPSARRVRPIGRECRAFESPLPERQHGGQQV